MSSLASADIERPGATRRAIPADGVSGIMIAAATRLCNSRSVTPVPPLWSARTFRPSAPRHALFRRNVCGRPIRAAWRLGRFLKSHVHTASIRDRSLDDRAYPRYTSGTSNVLRCDLRYTFGSNAVQVVVWIETVIPR